MLQIAQITNQIIAGNKSLTTCSLSLGIRGKTTNTLLPISDKAKKNKLLSEH
jgi:hypothetical protein